MTMTRRALLAQASLGTMGFGLAPPAPAGAVRAGMVVPLAWLGGDAPAVPVGVAWGVPWPRGALPRHARPAVVDGAGRRVAAQSWPMAYWPDGSLKWTGLAIAADARTAGLRVIASPAGAAPPAGGPVVTVREDAATITIDTGVLTATIARRSEHVITSLVVAGREVARAGRLVAIREDRARFADEGVLRHERFGTQVTGVVVEHAGPVRAVVRIEGHHAGHGRQWLPFCLRLYLTAGLASMRLVHSFVFDGDQRRDFIKGLGLAFNVPFREEPHNRHVRFATDGDHLFAEPVLLAPGYRPSAVGGAAAQERAQLDGQRLPGLADYSPADRANLLSTAVWNDFKLAQLDADGWQIGKRTNPQSAWLHATSGTRAGGLGFLGDVSGGLAVGLKDFWQRYPAAIEVTDAAAATGTLTTWFWSPDAPAMDLRHYDTVGHGLPVTYEDYEADKADAHGAASTADLMLWATADTPAAATLAAMARTAAAPPLLTCPPGHYHATRTLGFWSLPGQPTPGLTAAEVAAADTQLDRAFAFFAGEVERRRWYGFWDYGDYRRTYDPIRHQWMYDIGGHGWNATELMPNVWLWFAFLRSGRADIFRAAEAMTRNTSEVDVYHLGPLAGLGSRHNVSHWGDSKEARINEAFLKRFHYYLTTDERMGDLLREPIAVIERTLAAVPPLRKVVPRPDVLPPQSFLRFGPDWLALASNWFTEWERTGDTGYRDWCLTGMRDIGADPAGFLLRDGYVFDPATKHLRPAGEPNQKPGQFVFLFAGDQIVAELIDTIPCPPFVAAWDALCLQFTEGKRANWYFEPRVTALAANATGRADLAGRAAGLYRALLRTGDKDYFQAEPARIDGPGVSAPALENDGRSTFTPAIATPEVSQWAINLLSMPELLRAFRARP